MRFTIVIFISVVFTFGQTATTVGQTSSADSTSTKGALKFSYKQLIVPSVLMAYGFWGNDNGFLKDLNLQIRHEVSEHIDKRFTIDDFSQYAPALTVYGLNAAGVNGKNDFKNRTLILATSYLIMSSTVLTLKTITGVERPDGSSRNSFPSGHTATAFMGAEFLYQEYKDQSIWYGIAGYAVAAGTGAFRIYNNRHWLTDVATGAGIGMLSTKIAYWSQPYLSRKLFGNRPQSMANGIVYPLYGKNQIGIGMSLNF